MKFDTSNQGKTQGQQPNQKTNLGGGQQNPSNPNKPAQPGQPQNRPLNPKDPNQQRGERGHQGSGSSNEQPSWMNKK